MKQTLFGLAAAISLTVASVSHAGETLDRVRETETLKVATEAN